MKSPNCQRCLGLDESRAVEVGVALSSLTQSAANGCSTCSILVDAVAKSADQESQDHVVAWDCSRIDGLRIVVSGPDQTFRHAIDLFALPGGAVPWKTTKRGEKPREISGSTGCEAALRQISAWMDSCRESHGCHTDGPVVLPMRLVDVYGPDVRLYAPDRGETGTYACLSHCWGRSLPLTTTRDTLPHFMECIPWDAIPRTFREAIAVVRRLGLRYIWIDALCIVQDSPLDWAEQSVQMAAIYSRGTVTIAATASPGGSDGLFRRSPSRHTTRPVHFLDGNSPQTLRARATLTHGHGPRPLPLLSRAWVLQERLLSPRVVHFTEDELVWECMECTTCECGCTRGLWLPDFVPFDKTILCPRLLGNCTGPDLRAKWHCLVDQYSRLKLTLPRDRLPAISGAAKRFASAWGTRYIAGLWEDGMERDLLWYRRSESVSGDEVERLADAPTWSWASVNAQVGHHTAMTTVITSTVLDVVAVPLDSDPFGRVGNACLRLSGLVVPVRLETCANGTLQVAGADVAGDQLVLSLDSPSLVRTDKAWAMKVATQFGALGENGINQDIALLLVATGRHRAPEETTEGPRDDAAFLRAGLLRVLFRGPGPVRDMFGGPAGRLTVVDIK